MSDIKDLVELARKVKEAYPEMTGSLTFHLCKAQPVPKVEVRQWHDVKEKKTGFSQ